MRMIFVNLPVKSLEASKRFFQKLGFRFNPDFSDDNAACMIVEENISVMLLDHGRFKDFIKGNISDTSKGTEVLTCLSASSKQEVGDTVAKAIAAGGKAWLPPMELGPMYGGSFQDLDGHVWELMYMPTTADG